MWYMGMMEYYLATKKDRIMAFAEKWMQLETIMLRK
jgi:rhamnogalacturonyl hydrolase YesR